MTSTQGTWNAFVMMHLQVMLVIEFLLPKPTGGWRPIGLYPTFQRWLQRWQRETRCLAAFRLATQAKSNATGKGKAVTDSIYRQSIRAEAAVDGGPNMCAASVFYDVAKCFDMVRHRQLAVRAARLGFPIDTLRMSLNSYRWPRKVKI